MMRGGLFKPAIIVGLACTILGMVGISTGNVPLGFCLITLGSGSLTMGAFQEMKLANA